MLKRPVYKFYATPRFSVNQFTDYMATTNASQRNKIIQRAKFPASKPITAYQFAKREIQGFLASGKGDFGYFDLSIAKLQHTIATDEERRDDARKDLKCIEAFIAMMKAKKLSKYDFLLKAADMALHPIPQVLINVRLDVSLTETAPNGQRHSGGIVLFTAATAESRKNIETRRRQVSQMVLWALEGRGNLDPLPRLCMSLDVFGGELVKASESSSRFRGYAMDACGEAALKWASIEPPADYDGPPWK